MPMTEAPSWWADVQESREELDTSRRSLEWSDEDFDLVPPTVGRWSEESASADVPRRRSASRFDRSVATEHLDPAGAVLQAQAERVARVHLDGDAVDAPGEDRRSSIEILAAPPVELAEREPQARRTVQITGRPGEARLERRRPPRTPAQMVVDRPDRIAMWAAAFGFLLLIVAYVSGS